MSRDCGISDVEDAANAMCTEPRLASATYRVSIGDLSLRNNIDIELISQLDSNITCSCFTISGSPIEFLVNQCFPYFLFAQE